MLFEKEKMNKDEVRRKDGSHYFCSDTEFCDKNLGKSNAS